VDVSCQGIEETSGIAAALDMLPRRFHITAAAKAAARAGQDDGIHARIPGTGFYGLP